MRGLRKGVVVYKMIDKKWYKLEMKKNGDEKYRKEIKKLQSKLKELERKHGVRT